MWSKTDVVQMLIWAALFAVTARLLIGPLY
jgi:hypothetical protein